MKSWNAEKRREEEAVSRNHFIDLCLSRIHAQQANQQLRWMSPDALHECRDNFEGAQNYVSVNIKQWYRTSKFLACLAAVFVVSAGSKYNELHNKPSYDEEAKAELTGQLHSAFAGIGLTSILSLLSLYNARRTRRVNGQLKDLVEITDDHLADKAIKVTSKTSPLNVPVKVIEHIVD